MGKFKVHRIPLGSYECNCYLLHDVESNTAIVIDCGDGKGLVEYMKENGLKPKINYGLLTHGHFDHALGVKYLQDNLGVVFFMSFDDLEASRMEPYLYTEVENVNPVYDNSDLTLDDFNVHVITTPGHTPGGVTYKIGDCLFTGDTLFKGTIGRTDLFGGNFDTLTESIRTKLFTLPGEFVVYPGHGEESSIANEKTSNRFLKEILGEELNG